ALNRVVRVPTDVPLRFERLDVAGDIAPSAAEFVVAGPLRPPQVAPSTPRPAAFVGAEVGVRPCLAAVVADLDARDRRVGPGAASSRTSPRATVRAREENSGIPGGIISARGAIRVSGRPSSSSSRRKRYASACW